MNGIRFFSFPFFSAPVYLFIKRVIAVLQREMEQMECEMKFILWRAVNLDAEDNRLKYYRWAEFISVE